MKARIVIFVMTLMGVLVSSAFAQVPQLINYQGVLTDPATGNPVSDGTYSITFSIYSVASGGTALWTETQNVTTTSGRFNVLLGSVNPIAYTVFSGGDRYLGVKVGTDAEMTPRKRVVSVGYAFMAYNADKVDGQELSTNDGTVNQSEDPVSWYKIKDMPAGFADGTDDTGGGAITSVDSLNGGTIHSTLNVEGDIRTGSGTPSITSPGSDDVESTDDVTADDDIRAGGDMIAQGHLWSVNSHVVAENGHIRTGATQPGYVGAGDIYAADDVIAGGSIETGTPSSSFGNGDIASTDDIIADDVVIGNGGVWGYSTSSDGVRGQTGAGGKSGVYGLNTDAGYGVTGRSNAGIGVFGDGGSGSGDYGGYFIGWRGIYVRGESNFSIYSIGTSGAANIKVEGGSYGLMATGTTSYGVYAQTGTGTSNYGGYFQGGNAVRAYATNTGGWQFYGTGGLGIYTNSHIYAHGTHVHDVAEPFEMLDKNQLEQGDVVVIDTEVPGRLKLSTRAEDPLVAGIVSSLDQAGLVIGARQDNSNDKPLALAGRALCKVDASYGPIKTGDLLTTSDTPGHAMKATDIKPGTILGKALEPLESGTGKIMVLVTLQ